MYHHGLLHTRLLLVLLIAILGIVPDNITVLVLLHEESEYIRRDSYLPLASYLEAFEMK